MIAFGKAVQPGRHADLISHLDVLPTLLELASADAEGLEGRSFARALEGLPPGTESAPWPDQVLTRLAPSGDGAMGSALRFGRWKYKVIGEEESLHDLEQDAREALDLSKDPGAARELVEEARAPPPLTGRERGSAFPRYERRRATRASSRCPHAPWMATWTR